METIQRYKLCIEYDGTDFVGWQVQNNGRSVQGVIEQALEQIQGTKVRIHGAGRTDAGVHAEGQVAHTDLSVRLTPSQLCNALNALLPGDVTVHSISIEMQDFHARFSASSRKYIYTVTHKRNSMDRRRQWLLFGRFDHSAVQSALIHLRGTHDFTTFSKYSPNVHHHYCHVFSAYWTSSGVFSHFHITANRFLHGMVRSITGELVLIGRGKSSAEKLEQLLAARDRSQTPMLAPPHGLVLQEVRYDAVERAIVSAIIDKIGSEKNTT